MGGKLRRIIIESAWCKRCGICVSFCPTKTLGLNGEGPAAVVLPEACTGCGLCERLCPDLAIRLEETG